LKNLRKTRLTEESYNWETRTEEWVKIINSELDKLKKLKLRDSHLKNKEWMKHWKGQNKQWLQTEKTEDKDWRKKNPRLNKMNYIIGS
jgi:hypothetical protein